MLDFDLAEPARDEVSAAKGDDAPLDFKLPDLNLDLTPEPAPVPGEPQATNTLDFDLGLGAEAPTALSVPDVAVDEPVVVVAPASPAAANADADLEFDVSLTESTFLGRPEPAMTLDLDAENDARDLVAPFDMKSIDLDLEVTDAVEKSPVAAAAQSLGNVVEPPAAVEPEAQTMLFDAAQVSTSVNPDFLTAQAETVVDPQFGQETELAAPDFDINANEEVATKMDLAKAYEEMGDFEGARELLQEVLKEGDAAQREKAQVLLTKVGG